MLKPLLSLLLIATTGCKQYAYYMSPFQSNDHPYRTLPRLHDGASAATYASGALTAGVSNDHWHDGMFSFQGAVYRAHQFSVFQAYYGATASLGNYHVSHYENPATAMDISAINKHAGNKFFGGIGGIGGADVVVRMGRGEWRILQVETTIQQEFGDYLNFRNRLPDSAASAISRVNPYASISFGTDLVGRLRYGVSTGYKFAIVTATRRLYGEFKNQVPYIVPNYVSQTIHVTKDRYTGFFQLNLGSKTGNIQFGLNLNISKKVRTSRSGSLL